MLNPHKYHQRAAAPGAVIMLYILDEISNLGRMHPCTTHTHTQTHTHTSLADMKVCSNKSYRQCSYIYIYFFVLYILYIFSSWHIWINVIRQCRAYNSEEIIWDIDLLKLLSLDLFGQY